MGPFVNKLQMSINSVITGKPKNCYQELYCTASCYKELSTLLLNSDHDETAISNNEYVITNCSFKSSLYYLLYRINPSADCRRDFSYSKYHTLKEKRAF